MALGCTHHHFTAPNDINQRSNQLITIQPIIRRTIARPTTIKCPFLPLTMPAPASRLNSIVPGFPLATLCVILITFQLTIQSMHSFSHELESFNDQ